MRRPGWRRRDGAGQATVELALLLPLVFFFLLVLIEAGLVVRDQVLVTHAAREAARAAAVDESSANADAAALAGTGLDGLTVTLSGRSGAGSHVTATVRYAEPGRIPLLAALSSRLVLTATATMRVEGSNAPDRPPPQPVPVSVVPPILQNGSPLAPFAPPTSHEPLGPLEP